MTSCLLPLLLLLSLSSTIPATQPTGVKVRITEKANAFVQEVGQIFLQELLNKPLQDVEIHHLKVKGLTLTDLTMDQSHNALSFQQDSGIQFEMRNLDFTARVDLAVSRWNFGQTVITGRGVRTTIGVSLNRNSLGRLNVRIYKCEFTVSDLRTQSTSILGQIMDKFIPVLKNYFANKVCPAIQTTVVPKLNSQLEDLTKERMLLKDLGIMLDSSLSGQPLMTSRSLDVPFKALVFRQGEAPTMAALISGSEPVLRKNDQMFYVGISGFLFNSFLTALYNAKAMALTAEVDKQMEGRGLKASLRTLQLLRQPSTLQRPLSFSLEAREVPSISFHDKGVTMNIGIRLRVFTEPKQPFLRVSAVCKTAMKVILKGNTVSLAEAGEYSCTIVTKNRFRDVMVKPLNTLLSYTVGRFVQGWFDEGVEIPALKGMDFTHKEINYYNGFVEVGGSLAVTSALEQQVMRPVQVAQGRRA